MESPFRPTDVTDAVYPPNQAANNVWTSAWMKRSLERPFVIFRWFGTQNLAANGLTIQTTSDTTAPTMVIQNEYSISATAKTVDGGTIYTATLPLRMLDNNYRVKITNGAVVQANAAFWATTSTEDDVLRDATVASNYSLSAIGGDAIADTATSARGVVANDGVSYPLATGSYVWNGTAWIRARAGNVTDGSSVGSTAVVIRNFSGYYQEPPPLLLDNDNGFRHQTFTHYNFNGVSYDRQRNNQDGTLLASAARTALAVPANITNHNSKGIMLVLNVTAKAAATTLQFTIDMIDPVSGANGFFVNSAAFAAAVGSNYVFVVYPGIIAADFAVGGATGAITARSAVLPRIFRVLVYPGDASSVTYSVGYSLIL